MNRLEALIGLNKVSDIGSIRLNRLLTYFDKPEKILEATQEQLIGVAGIGEKIAHQIISLKPEDIEREFRFARRDNLRIITVDEYDYPKNLKYIPDPPIVLYVKGQLAEQDVLSIAIVGARRASFYGLSHAERFARDLSLKGFTIVSGMARGIDTCAHRGALKNKGRTIAVIGSGFAKLYPPENKELAQEIARHGAVISEFSVETEPLKQNFPRRNRLISGLSLGVLVVEAARNSGALITADFALEQGRDVFALPGKIDSDSSCGTNALIKEGARLVTCAEEILEEFNFLGTQKKDPGTDNRGYYNEERPDLKLDEKEAFLYNLLLPDRPFDLDQIIELSHTNIAGVSEILLRLQIKRLVRQLPGKLFERVQHER